MHWWRSCLTSNSRKGRCPIDARGLGVPIKTGRKRVPMPPTKRTAFRSLSEGSISILADRWHCGDSIRLAVWAVDAGPAQFLNADRTLVSIIRHSLPKLDHRPQSLFDGSLGLPVSVVMEFLCAAKDDSLI